MKIIDSVYCHISNSGFTVMVVDEGNGPLLKIICNTFGSMENTFNLHTTATSLKVIGEMLLRASKEQFSEVYCNAAEYYPTNTSSTK